MSRLSELRQIASKMPQIARETDRSVLSLYLSFIRCYLCSRANLDEFELLGFYNLSADGLKEYTTSHRRNLLQRVFNRGITTEEMDSIHLKNLFNTNYSAFIRRDWLYLPDAGEEALRTFLAAHDTIFIKPCSTSGGEGIQKRQTCDITVGELLTMGANGSWLLESCIRQHPDMAALNPSSVSTVRILTARRGDRVIPVGAGLRCGAVGQFVDNFHQGGSAYPLDLETGIICSPGRISGSSRDVIRNPVSGQLMPGFAVPHWNTLIRVVCQAALTPPHIGLIAWDVAITEDGVELLEGNVYQPGMTVVQLGGNGIQKKLINFLKSKEP